MIDYLLQRRLDEQTQDMFSMTDFSTIWYAYPPAYYLSRVELMVLWRAFSDTACAIWLIVNKDTASQFADWIKEVA